MGQFGQPDQRPADDKYTQPEPQKHLDVKAHLFLQGSRRLPERVLVPDAAKRLDPVQSIGAGTELAAQVTDMGIDAAIEWRKGSVQDRTHELVASDRASGIAQERLEEIELDGGQFDRFTTAANDPRCFVDRDVVDNQFTWNADVHRTAFDARPA